MNAHTEEDPTLDSVDEAPVLPATKADIEELHIRLDALTDAWESTGGKPTDISEFAEKTEDPANTSALHAAHFEFQHGMQKQVTGLMELCAELKKTLEQQAIQIATLKGVAEAAHRRSLGMA